MPKQVGQITTDFFSIQKLKFDAMLSELEVLKQAIEDKDIRKAEKSSRELNKISEFDVVSASTIHFKKPPF